MRAYNDMQSIADAIEALSPRQQRKLLARRLNPAVIRNDAERIMDVLSVHDLLRVANGIEIDQHDRQHM